MTRQSFDKLNDMEFTLAELLEAELDAKNYSDLREAYMKIALVVRRNEFRFTSRDN